ncbi:c-type cytochrome [Pseudoponticoccus marisrubri]|uniref:MFS transporter n=1 Tax=Pseudoponticoccus marisrubri TaxID=1685382 RepID=A0A0W7WFJ2_9RHOB|nr:c-type cytochrome [Pseudoponticoccus marisrubri]KUF09284.1 MFS transporter [Pseudoponticoccus marisrubri]
MSKSLNLYVGLVAGIGVTLVAAYNFADRNVAGFPRNAPTLGALPAPIPEPEAPVQQAQAPAAEAPEDGSETAAADAPEGGLIAAAHADQEATGLRFGLGRAALPEEIAAWDVDVRPDGSGLPEGTGNAWDGEALFEDNCASCHGSFAEGVGNWPKLAGGDGTLADEDPLKTVGSYWPYTSTVWDYVHRSMPFGGAQTLSDDDVYAIVAYILYSNDIIDDEFEVSHETLPTIELPNADGFIIDDRAETEYSQWRAEPCMENCKDGVEITMRATVLDVTPDEAVEESAEMDSGTVVATAAPAEDAAPVETAEAAAPTEEAAAPVEEAAALDPELVKAGERVFNKCKACHQVGDGAKNRTGPHLNDVMGREIGGIDDFRYSRTMEGMDGVWTEETLAAFLENPRGYVKGTKMAFAGLRKAEEIAAVTEFLKSHAQ